MTQESPLPQKAPTSSQSDQFYYGTSSTWSDVKVYLSHQTLNALLLLVCIGFQCYMAIISDSRYIQGTNPLSDRIHGLLNGVPSRFATKVVDPLCLAFLILTLIRFVVFTEWRIASAIFNRYFLCMAVAYFFRGIAIALTTLPNPLIECEPVTIENFWMLPKIMVQAPLGLVYQCTDMIISGHTIYVTTTALLWIYYSSKPKLVSLVVGTFAIWMCYLIITSFYHYTIDVLFGSTLSVAIWAFYHFLLDIASHPYKMSNKEVMEDDLHKFLMARYPFVSFLARFIAKCEALDYRFSTYTKVTMATAKPVNGNVEENVAQIIKIDEGETMTQFKEMHDFSKTDAPCESLYGARKMLSFKEIYLGNSSFDLTNLRLLVSVLAPKRCNCGRDLI